MEYAHFTVEDFIKDERFQQWVYSQTPENEAFWNTVVQRHPHQALVIQEARIFLISLHFREEDIFESRINKIKSNIDLAIDSGETKKTTAGEGAITPWKKKSNTQLYAAAAGLALIAIMAAMFLWSPFRKGNNIPENITEFRTTSKGQRTLVTLEDGTRVWLNAESTLNYSKAFYSEATRDVFLNGEAFFDVAENKNKPFIVHTGAITIRVLGTAFNVRSYETDKEIETTLVRGKVMIESSDDDHFALAPSQQAVFDKSSKRITLSNQVDTESYTGWKEGKLIFVDQPLKEIVAELERWYDVTIDVADNTSLHCRFSANINNKTLPEVLELFKASDGIDYRVNGNRISIIGTLCDD